MLKLDTVVLDGLLLERINDRARPPLRHAAREVRLRVRHRGRLSAAAGEPIRRVCLTATESVPSLSGRPRRRPTRCQVVLATCWPVCPVCMRVQAFSSELWREMGSSHTYAHRDEIARVGASPLVWRPRAAASA